MYPNARLIEARKAINPDN